MVLLLAALLIATAVAAGHDSPPLSATDLSRARSACVSLLAGAQTDADAADLPFLVLRRPAAGEAFEPDEALQRGIAAGGVPAGPLLVCVRETAVRCGDPAQAPPALEWRVVRRLAGEVAAVRLVGQPADVEGEYLELPFQLRAWLGGAGEHRGLPIMATVVGEAPTPPPGAARCAEAHPPQPIEQAPPRYPAEAKAKRVQGVVMVEARIDAEGRVEDVEVRSGHPLLAEAARESIRKWRFRPALCDGRPVATILTLSTRFSLKD